MTHLQRKIFAALMAVLLCLTVVGCAEKVDSPNTTDWSKPHKPILPGVTDPDQAADHTAVYVTVFEDLAILSAYPVMEYDGEEPECDPREISQGGSILCGGEHEREEPIRHVLIIGELVPRAMNDWFRNMVTLQSIEGLEKVRTHHVSDMSHLFAGCQRLSEADVSGWDVSEVEDMTGMFDGCTALADLPQWYAPDGDTLG